MTGLPIFPLRVNFTHEDKAAKGLRSLREPTEANQEPVYFTAREMVDANPHLVLLGGPGSGKTTFARALARQIGATLIEVTDLRSLDIKPEGQGLLIVDGIDRLGPDGERRLADIVAGEGERPILLLGDPAVISGWVLPQGFQVHSLMPLTEEDREAAVQVGISPAVLSPIAAHPAFFAAAAELLTAPASAEALADFWVESHPGSDVAALEALASGRSANRALDQLLAARALATRPVEEAIAHFVSAPDLWTPVLVSRLLRRPDQYAEIEAALLSAEPRAAMLGALLLAPHAAAGETARASIKAKLLAIIEGGHLSARQRDRAARILSVWGDPRDFDALCAIPGGTFTMGSDSHPNSQPIHEVSVAGFRIGAYPVTNGQYARFVEVSGHPWNSPEAGNSERINSPATDLTWRDANAYCAWLTEQWRASGKIGADEVVRLATEPEWERAARGDQPAAGASPVYPWGLEWNREACNCEETGFNEKCAAGLFPQGRSPYGCWDMAGQVWEWTSTLWGDDMATPHFKYPYRDDGRENPDAGPTIRRVLRGGCFSSTRLKAGAVYRGSLEPDGFWRGNGFRIVVAKAQ